MAQPAGALLFATPEIVAAECPAEHAIASGDR